jgi:uncharacterized protein (TIGR03083 family)
MAGERVAPFAERLDVLTGESARLERYFRGLSREAWNAPSACAQWQVADVVAHLVGVAEFYAGTVERGLRGETAPPPGRAPAGTGTGASAAEGIAQRSIAARKTLGDQLLDAFAGTGAHLNRTLAALTAEQRQIPCYHPGGMVPTENFIELRLKELGVHVRAGLESAPHLSAACFPAILATISESMASGSLRWAFWSGPTPGRAERYRFAVAGPGPTKPDLVIDGTAVRMEEASTGSPDVTFSCDTEAYIRLVYGRLDLQAAIGSGQVRVDGDRALATDFGRWFRGI